MLVLVAIALAIGQQSAFADDAPRSFQTVVLAASGVSPEKLDHHDEILDRLAHTFRASHDPRGDTRARARALHAYLHKHVLRGTYRASASHIGIALEGGPFNCAAATALFLTMAARAGLDAQPVSVRGHVWCRVNDAGQSFDVETTCPDWFEVAERYSSVPTEEVSAAMAAHRRRLKTARVLSDEEFLAIFHFNQGVTLLRQQKFTAAVQANQRALSLDPDCRPAQLNLAAAQNAAMVGQGSP